jgi:Fe(3+) dicitrate transport protein
MGPRPLVVVINYLTPNAPVRATGAVTLTGGNRDFFNGGAGFGGSWGDTGVIANYTRKQSDGARENTHADLHDLSLKLHRTLTSRQALTVKTSYYGETSNLTYSGLTEAGVPGVATRETPFRNDFFYVDRLGASVSHAYVPGGKCGSDDQPLRECVSIEIGGDNHRSSAQRPNDVADPKCGGMVNLLTTCGNEGRVRSYDTWGWSPGCGPTSIFSGYGTSSTLGDVFTKRIRKRLQLNGETPQARDGVVIENNLRRNSAVSAFVQNRLSLGRLALTPGVRLERIGFETDQPAGQQRTWA